MKLRFILLFITISILAEGSVYAQKKIIDKSERKKPDWVNATLPSYIIVTARAETLDEAKQQIIPNIRKEIVNSVAVYVRSSSSSTLIDKNDNGVISTVEQFVSESHTQAADIPIIKNLSLSNAEAYYWEKYKDKETGEISCVYHVKYPFSQLERSRIVNAFNKQDAEMEELLKQVQTDRKTLSSTSQLSDNLNTIKKLRNYFPDNRKEMADLEYKYYNDLLDNLHIKITENSKEGISFKVIGNGKSIKVSEKISITTSYGIKTKPIFENNGIYTVEYSDESSLTFGEKYIDIEISILSKRLYKRVELRPKETPSKILSIESINIQFTKEGEDFFITKVKIFLNADISRPILVQSLVINWESTGLRCSVPIEAEVKEGGYSTLIQSVSVPVSSLNIKSAEPYISGGLVYHVNNTTNRFNFYYVDFAYEIDHQTAGKQPESSAKQ